MSSAVCWKFIEDPYWSDEVKQEGEQIKCSVEFGRVLCRLHGARPFTKLKPLVISNCPFVNLPETHKGRWGEGLAAADMQKCARVKPQFVAQIEFLEWTESEKSASDYTRSSSTA